MKKLLFLFLTLANLAHALTPIAQWQGNSELGQFVATVGNNLITTGSYHGAWVDSATIPNCEGDHWLMTSNYDCCQNDNSTVWIPWPVATPNFDSTQPWEISFIYKTNSEFIFAGSYYWIIDTVNAPYDSAWTENHWWQSYTNDDGTVHIDFQDGVSVGFNLNGITNIMDGNAHTIKFAGDSTGTRLYVDGELEAETEQVAYQLFDYPWGLVPGEGDWDSQIQLISSIEGQYFSIDNFTISTFGAVPTPTPTATPTPRGIAYRPGAKADLDFSGAQSGTITISATEAATLDIPVITPADGKMVMVTGWTISSVDSVTVNLHFGTGGAKFGIGGNFIAGGFLGEYGRLTAQIGTLAQLAPTPGQGIYLDVDGATEGLEVQVTYVIY